jgi:hypothetical protein
VQKSHDFLYWEFHEKGSQQAVRMGDWKYIRRATTGAPERELYDLKSDLGEAHNVLAQHPTVVAEIEKYLKKARIESKQWPIKPKGQQANGPLDLLGTMTQGFANPGGLPANVGRDATWPELNRAQLAADLVINQ